MTTRATQTLTAWLLRLPTRLYDHNAGWLLGRRVLRLTHRGRRSGREYHTALEVIGTDRASGEVMVLAGWGRSADWYRNLQTQPVVEVAIARRRFTATHRELDEREASEVLADYEHRNRWMSPLVRRGLSWLTGWSYDSSHEARHRLVRELPILAFAPRG